MSRRHTRSARLQPSVAWAAGIILAAAVSTLLASPPTLPVDKGASGLWQQLLKLQTTASALHTTAHPDDEHGGVLTMLSRRDGARVSLLTLTRGEAGDNAIGPQLFDGLGVIRTEELLDADAYYGVGTQYFTTVADYGFSKRLDEALDTWGEQNVLRDVVRVIRMDRPFVLISRFQGNARDGHGNHSTAGLITQEAFKAAGDPKMFPEQIADGLRPWQPFKVYIGGVREHENWTLRVDPGEYSPWLGDSYANFARLGLSFQRSQNSGRYAPQLGPSPAYYTRVATTLSAAPEKESSFFDGIDTTIPALFRTLGETPLPGGDTALQQIDRAVRDAVAAFNVSNPSLCVPALAAGLKATRLAINAATTSPDAMFALEVKEQQFQDAINIALGVELIATASVRTAPAPGQSFEVVTELANRSPIALGGAWTSTLNAPRGWRVQLAPMRAGPLAPGAVLSQRFAVTLGDDVAISTRPYFGRASIAESRYSLADELQFGRPGSAPPAVASASYRIGAGPDGVEVHARAIVRRREPKPPYGDALRELGVVPALALTLDPGVAVVPLSAARKQIAVSVDLLNNRDGATAGRLALRMPAGWTSAPAAHDFTFVRAGERRAYRFTVSIPSIEDEPYALEAVATSGGREYREGYDLIDERDLELRYLYRPAKTMVRGVAVSVPAKLQVGYVMGIGDQVPAGIAQLGHAVTLLDERELASGNLQRFDAIVTGTRAYAVRDDLVTYNQRLLDYAKAGGNLIVLYNTAELVPSKFAPYAGELTPQAEEVSEEDSPVNILAPADQAFTWPNTITKSDFDGWIEQRGSKFWSTWAPEYTPMIETWDKGQAPQKGGWLSARYGKGRYTYFAYAFHRQLPYGVPGAYRLLENVL
ncbi:MAG: PIG-L family deacetylase, partial [Acidobacteriia bacterium]|nr:PIG-L family deacetylase [Terriglobia bacterium]